VAVVVGATEGVTVAVDVGIVEIVGDGVMVDIGGVGLTSQLSAATR